LEKETLSLVAMMNLRKGIGLAIAIFIVSGYYGNRFKKVDTKGSQDKQKPEFI